MNKFERLFSDDHQMSVVGEGVGTQFLRLRWAGVSPQVNKFEQLFSDDHQMSVVGDGVGTQFLRLGWEGVSPQVNKFEQVSSDDHQMSVPGKGGVGTQVPYLGPISGGGGMGGAIQVPCLEEGRVTLPCDLSHDVLDVAYLPSPWTDRRLWKHYLPQTLFACSRYNKRLFNPLLGNLGSAIEYCTI